MEDLERGFLADSALPEKFWGKFQVLVNIRKIVRPEHGVQGVVYYVAVPKQGMQVVPVYVLGKQDVDIEPGIALLVRFVDVELFADDNGLCAEAQYIEVVDSIEEDRYSV